MTKDMDELKNRLNRAMRIKNMKPLELSQKTNIPKSSISQYMSGYAKPKQDRIFAISEALGISEAWLMGFDVPMDKTQNTPDNAQPKSIEQMTAREILERAEELGKTTYDIIGYDGRNTTRTTLTEDEYEKVMGIIEILRKENR